MNNEQLSMNAECDTIGNIKNKRELTPSADITKEKTCPKCKQTLPFDMFNRRNGNTFILNSYCRICQPIVYHDWRVKNLEKVKIREKLYRLSNKEKIRIRQKEYMKQWIACLNSRFVCWKKRATQRGIPFELTLEQLETMPLVCHYTGNALTFDSNKWNTISLDRLDSSKGYVITNVVFCCSFVNLMKHELSYDEFINSCRSIVNHYKKIHKS